MTFTLAHPRAAEALDYPDLPDDLWIMWTSNGIKWPSGARQTFFMSKTRTGALKGNALWTVDWQDARRFATDLEAIEFFREQELLLGRKLENVRITTVAMMKAETGFYLHV